MATEREPKARLGMAVKSGSVGAGKRIMAMCADNLTRVLLELGEPLRRGVIAPVGVRDRQPKNRAPAHVREGALVFDAEVDVTALEPKMRISRERSRQEPHLREDLKTVADADDKPAFGGMLLYGVHDG